MKTVTFYPEDIDAVSRALSSLQADIATLERLGIHSPELVSDAEVVEGLRDRMLAEHNEIRDRLASHPFDIRQWIDENLPRLRSVS